ncbi:MAG: transporter ATP-binding protein [Rhodoglobus sp.]|nr:transporter ATP-binding protein [Rhodoglobus sp.]
MTDSATSNDALTDEPLLRLTGVSKVFGTVAAVKNVNLDVRPGEHRALIGPNGAGKSTLFKLVTGQLPPTDGSIVFGGDDVSGWPAFRRARVGMAMTFQHSNLFDDLTVRENVTLAVQRQRGRAGRVLTPLRREREVHERVAVLLEESKLSVHADRPAGALAHGQRRRVEIALAYATEPRLLLLDEPAAGMSPGEIEDFLDLLLSRPNLTFVMIEHNIDLVMRIASSISVLDAGEIIAEGPPASIVASEAVQVAYLGSAGKGTAQ